MNVNKQLALYKEMQKLYVAKETSKYELDKLAKKYKKLYGEAAMKQFWQESDGF